ncbi:uncharacterized protein LOC142152015 [Mixophyes fleayi]|uniref:uncharacterized protein LOC142152015 n=1 Tax=Mixophyes fleayi TaxID=3061075 RepID=UPI003F4E3B41
MSTMYRAYQPTLPTANLYLQEKWDRSRYAEHRRKVAGAVPAVDCKGSQTPIHLLVNMKKIQMDRDQRALIEKQNHIHSTKLSAIRQSQGRLDNWNYYAQRSLNIGQRHQNLSRLTEENGKILERILKRESEYRRWKSEWEKVERMKANISHYPQDSGPAWAGEQTVTFMDNRRNVDIHCLEEESKTDSTQSRSTLKLESIPQTAGHRTKELSFYTDNSRQVTPIQAEKSTQALYGESAYCDSEQGSTYSFRKSGNVHSAISEITEHKLQAKCKSRYKKSFSNSEKDITGVNPRRTGIFQEDSEGKEDLSLELCVREKCQSRNEHNQCTTQSKKKCGRGMASYISAEREPVVSDTEEKTHMLYVGSDRSFDFSPVESNASSCYSLKDSEKSSHPSSPQNPGMSESLSSLLSLNLKTRATSISTTSQKSPETPETSLHKLEISNTSSQNASRSQNPSPEESKSHYPLPQPTNSSSGPSSRVINKSPDSLSLVTNMDQDLLSQGVSMTAVSQRSSSSTNTQRSPDLITQNTSRLGVPLTRQSKGTLDSSSKVSTKINFEGKIYKALHYLNEALYK